MNEAIKKAGYINNIFQYIENNMPDELDAALLTNIGYVSCDKLYRDFYSITGHSVKEYIRKRRLSNALALIKTSNMGLTDIAYQCGYSSHQAMCRTIKQMLGLTPSEYKSGDIYYFFPPYNGEPLHPVIVLADEIPFTLCVVFYHSGMKNIENNAVDTFLWIFPDYNGRIFGRNGKQSGNKFCYELYLTETGRDYDKLIPYGFELTRETPCFSALFAKCTVKNDERKINAAWDYLYSEWLQNSMFEYTGEPYYEEYILRNGKPFKLKLYLPIKKRNAETKITLINNPGLRFIVSKAKGYNAEKIASKTVVEYLTAHYPYIVKNSKEMYVRKDINTYECGIRIDSDVKIAGNANIENIKTDDDDYLILESNVTGDYNRYADLLFSFAKNNGMETDEKEIFAVYDAAESFENLKIKMYCPVRYRKK